MKNATVQVTYSLNGPVVNLLLYCHIILNLENVTFSDNLATILPLKFKLFGKFQSLNANDGSIEMLQNN